VNNTVHDTKPQVRRPQDRRAKDNLREMAQAGVLAGADDVLNPGVHPVGGVDVGGLAQPAFRRGRAVGGPQRVPPSVLGLEQGQLRSGVRPFPAGEDPHRGGPAGELIPGRAFAQQRGQLGDAARENLAFLTYHCFVSVYAYGC
jgi:hypothetical protein